MAIWPLGGREDRHEQPRSPPRGAGAGRAGRHGVRSRPRPAAGQGGAARREHPSPAAAADPRPSPGRCPGVRRSLRPRRRLRRCGHAGGATSAHGPADRLLAARGRGPPPRLPGQRRAVRPGPARPDDGGTRHRARRAVAGEPPPVPARRAAVGGAARRAPGDRTRLRAPRDAARLHLGRADGHGADGLVRRRDLTGQGVHAPDGGRPRPRRRRRRRGAPGTRLRVRAPRLVRLRHGRGRPAGPRRDALPRHGPALAAAHGGRTGPAAAARRRTVRGAAGHVVELRRPVRGGDRRLRRAVERRVRPVRRRRRVRREPAGGPASAAGAAQAARPGKVTPMTVPDSRMLAFVADSRWGVLATIKRDGRPQLSNVGYAYDAGTQLIRVSVTDDRAKTRNLRADPRVALHVTSKDFWTWVVVEGIAELMPVASDPHDATVEELVAYYRGAVGEHPNWDEYRRAMVAERRLVVRFHPEHAYGQFPRGPVVLPGRRAPCASARQLVISSAAA